MGLSLSLGLQLGSVVTRSTGGGVQLFRNWTPTNTSKIKASKTNVGSSRSRWAFIGSSSVVGIGAGDGVGSKANARQRVFHAVSAAQLTVAGVNSRWSNMWGCQGYPTGTDLNLIDPRINFATGWANALGNSLGDSMFTNTTTTSDLTFAPTDAFDTLEIWFSRFSGGGTFETFIDGVSIGQTVMTGTAGAAKATFTGIAKGVHTVVIRRVTGSVSIIGIETFDSTAPGIDFQGMGWTGSQVSDWINASSPRGPINALKTYAPDVTFVLLGNNDEVNGVAVATYKAGMQALIDAAKVSGDCVLIAPQFINTDSAPQALQDAYRQAQLELSSENNLPIVMLCDLIGTYASNPGAYRDSLHVTQVVHADLGQRLAAQLLAV